MSVQNPIVSNLVVGPIDRTASTPSISFGGSAENNSGTGIYGSFGQINMSVNGSLALSLVPQGIVTTNNVVILNGAGAPVDGTTGDNLAGTGSLYINITDGELYINTGLITNPTWVLIGPLP